MKDYFAVVIGGGVGSLSRYVLAEIGLKYNFTYHSTLLINILGCVIIGMISFMAIHKSHLFSETLILFLTVGIAGGFTTFSTYTLEAVILYQNGYLIKSLAYLFLSPIFGLCAVVAGIGIAKVLCKFL